MTNPATHLKRLHHSAGTLPVEMLPMRADVKNSADSQPPAASFHEIDTLGDNKKLDNRAQFG